MLHTTIRTECASVLEVMFVLSLQSKKRIVFVVNCHKIIPVKIYSAFKIKDLHLSVRTVIILYFLAVCPDLQCFFLDDCQPVIFCISCVLVVAASKAQIFGLLVYFGMIKDAMTWPNFLLTFADVILSVFVAFPLSVLHWRGTWELQDVYFFPADREKSLWTSFAVGANVCVIELLIQPYLSEKLGNSSRRWYVFVSRLHLYIHGWAVMCYWRGLWDLLDLYLTTGWINAVVVYSTCQLIMVMARTVRTAVGIPISLRLDTSADLLEADLVFKTSVSLEAQFQFDIVKNR